MGWLIFQFDSLAYFDDDELNSIVLRSDPLQQNVLDHTIKIHCPRETSLPDPFQDLPGLLGFGQYVG